MYTHSWFDGILHDTQLPLTLISDVTDSDLAEYSAKQYLLFKKTLILIAYKIFFTNFELKLQ